MQRKDSRYTLASFTENAVRIAQNDPEWLAASTEAPIEYISKTSKPQFLTDYKFDVCGSVIYGTNEGIYGEIRLKGVCEKKGEYCNTRLLLVKALPRDKKTYIGMHKLIGLICYYANRIVEEDIQLFS